MKKIILTLSHLKKNYQEDSGETKAIEDISLEVEEGKFISIVGPSGCGKSTLLSIFANLEVASGGTYTFEKPSVRIAYMLQKDSLFPWRTILDNCLLGLELRNELTEENRNYVLHLLKTYGLADFIDKYPNSLSGGMRQRVALIRTLAIHPDILLLDEPFSALDAMTRVALAEDVYNMIKKEGKTVLMVTHDIGEAVSLSDKIVVLTKRPSTVKKIYDIHLTGKSTPIKNRKCKEFSEYYDAIWRDLDVHI